MVRETASRPGSLRPGRAASFGGSRASSPAQQRRSIVFGSRAPSPTRGHSQSTRYQDFLYAAVLVPLAHGLPVTWNTKCLQP